MTVVSINDPQSGSSARIAANAGFNCFEFLASIGDAQVSVIDAAEGFENGDKPPSHSGIPILFPYPNRIRGGKYSWEGTEYDLPESLVAYDGAGNAIHGFCLDLPWLIEEQTDGSVTGVFQISEDAPDRLPLWPTDALLRIKYSLNGACLRTDIEVSNPTDTPLPWGFGTHAYFRVPLTDSGSPENCTVYAPVTREWDLEECLPTGSQKDPAADGNLIQDPGFTSLKLDNVYTGVHPADGIVECRLTDTGSGLKMTQRCDDSFRDIVAFTPPWTSAVCLEPYTCVTDAINLQQQGVDAGLQVLEPGGTWTGWIEIAVEAS